jgi:polynucleotide 5'-hydroxyl-kinase GRC3/NOL9
MQIEGIDIPSAWAEAAERLTSGANRRVLVIGPADSGKTSLCRVLFAACHEGGPPAALVDTDLGQKLVGPPACVTLGAGSTQIPNLVALAFVGTTDPMKGWRALRDGALTLMQRAGAGPVIVNTSGLVQGPGRALKADKIQLLEPDLILALGSDPDVEAVLAGLGNAVIRLPAAPGARRKSGAERRRSRRQAFRDYFQNARIQVLSIQPPSPWPEGLLVGLADADGTDVGLALVREARPDGTAVLTPDLLGQPRQIKPGLLVLDQDFAELPGPMAGRPEPSSP